MTPALRTPTIAHVAPLAVLLGLSALVPLVVVENTMLPWWRHAPEQWVYPLQTVIVGVLLWRLRGFYTFTPLRGFPLAVIFGIIGILWWGLPALLWQKLTAAGVTVPAWCEWLGLAEREEGFDPTLFRDHPPWHATALAMRFIRLAIIVPFVEEIFWRGFLMRYVQADGGNFQRIPFGRHSWRAFAVSTLGFMLVHHHTDWVGALGFGSLMYVLAVRTKSLAACVLMHAVANLLLGAYVVTTEQWGFW
jgi:CAAX prenyl protease-like protein